MGDGGKGRILMLLENDSFPTDGRVRREALCLQSAGYTVTVISPAPEGGRLFEVVDGVRALRYPAPPERDGLLGYVVEYGYAMLATLILTLVAAVRPGFDVIHAHNPPDTFALIAALFRPFGKRFVFDHHDLSPEMYDARFGDRARPPVRRVLLLLERVSFRLADLVIATNESYREIAITRGGVAPERVHVVRNGPDLERVRVTEPDPALRSRAGTVIGYVGLMGYQDGVHHLIRALAHLRELGRDDFLAVLVGKGDSIPTLKRLVAELGLERHVEFAGRVPDEQLMRILSTADICVDPDPSNPFNDRSTMIKMTEYMALGKPIVAFDLPEHRVTAGESAVYARPNDERDFALKLAELMDDPERREAMGKTGRHRAETELAWPHQRESLLEAYRMLRAS